MKTVVSIHLGESARDFEFSTTLLGAKLRLRRIGVNGDLERAARLLERFSEEADQVSLGGLSPAGALVRRDKRVAEFVARAAAAQAATGTTLARVHEEWAVRQMQRERPGTFVNARVLFLSGMEDYALARLLSQQTKNLFFADPILRLGLPKLLGSLSSLRTFARAAALRTPLPPQATRERELAASGLLANAVADAHVLVLHRDLIAKLPWDLRGKVVLTSAISDEMLAQLRAAGAYAAIDRAPRLLDRPIECDLLEGALLAATNRIPTDMGMDDYLQLYEELRPASALLHPFGVPRQRNRFAFVIHPLSREFLKESKPLALAARLLPKRAMRAVEKVAAHAPPFLYSKVTGIRSPTGAEAEGWLISVASTPREMLSRSPEFTYRQMVEASRMAERLGAQIMGLGAFTKVVGDAGVTVARRASLPVTTGNSYSASGALWAAHDAARRMGLLEIDAQGKVAGKAMVVGATGSIGAVCARLLAMAFDELHLVAPDPAKLLLLRDAILEETPSAKVHLSSSADENLREMDLIVTATSAAGKRVVDILKVKAGAIITDVSRPLDLSAEDVALRPDILVLESGEIQLPGEPKMRSIGLPPGVAYACLAETIVLALEGRFEPFTLGREIEWARVKEIYKLGLKHGMALAAISGVNGLFSDEAIAEVRARALAVRAESRAEAEALAAKRSARLRLAV